MCAKSVRECSHEVNMIEGFWCCTKCGKVTENECVFYEVDVKPNIQSEYFHDTPVSNVESRYQNEKKFQPLLDFVKNANLPIKYAEEAYQLFLETEKKARTKQYVCLLFACQYEILQRHSVFHTMRELTAFTHVSCSSIAKAYHQFIDSTHILKPASLVDRYCSKLNLSRMDAKEIRTSLDGQTSHYFSSRHPSTVVAVFIYNYCKKEKIDVNLKRICEICGISKISATRLLKLMST